MTAVRLPAVVVNPTKVDDRSAAHDDVAAALAAVGLPEALWFETTEVDPGQGQTAKALAAGADLVLALGGDGTVRSCANELAGTDVPLALLPVGTGNLLARNLGVPLDLEGAVGVAAAGRHRRIDLVDLDGDLYTVMGGCGFDAAVFDETSQRLKANVGWAAYVAAGLKAIRDVRPVPVEVAGDGRAERFLAVGVVVGNVGRLTGGVPLLPDAEADDGLLHVAVLTPTRARDWAGLVVRVLARRDPRPYQMRTFTAREVRLGWPSDISVEVDGDVVEPRRQLSFAVRPAALTVCVPAAGSDPAA